MAPTRSTAVCVLRVEHQPHASLITLTVTDDITASQRTQHVERFTDPATALAAVADFLEVTRREQS